MLVATGLPSILSIHIAAVTAETEGSMAMQIIHMIAITEKVFFTGLDQTMKCCYGEGGTAMTGGSDVVQRLLCHVVFCRQVCSCYGEGGTAMTGGSDVVQRFLCHVAFCRQVCNQLAARVCNCKNSPVVLLVVCLAIVAENIQNLTCGQ